MNWILASGSPRRRELLEMLGVPDLTIRPATGPERATPGAGPEQTVRELSLHKAQEVAQTCAPEDIIIAADTIVYLDGAILGKPRDAQDAAAMLRQLSGQTHRVITAVALHAADAVHEAASESRVRFAPLGEDDIAAYVDSGEWQGKAGAYAIQGRAAAFIAHISGSYSGIMGLPLFETARILRAAGAQ